MSTPPPPPPPGQPGDANQSWGQQDPGQSWGSPPPPAGQEYGGQPYGRPTAGPAGAGYASWIQRVLGYLVDAAVLIPAYIVVFIGLIIGASGAETTYDPTTGMPTTEGGNAGGFVIMGAGYLIMIGIAIWNQIIRQGRTGWSIGKQVVGIRLLKEDTGQPMGAGMCFVRSIAHIVDAIPCYIGFLWPLWDAKRQTFADKIMTTVVVEQKKS